MAKCGATKRDGSPCTLQALRDSDFCWAHDPRNAEKRRSGQSRGGRSKPLKDLAILREKLVQLDDVMAGKADKGRASVAAVCYGTAIKATEALTRVRELEESRIVETQLKVEEQREIVGRLEELEALLAKQEAG